jgi:hypothetical protein
MIIPLQRIFLNFLAQPPTRNRLLPYRNKANQKKYWPIFKCFLKGYTDGRIPTSIKDAIHFNGLFKNLTDKGTVTDCTRNRQSGTGIGRLWVVDMQWVPMRRVLLPYSWTQQTNASHTYPLDCKMWYKNMLDWYSLNCTSGQKSANPKVKNNKHPWFPGNHLGEIAFWVLVLFLNAISGTFKSFSPPVTLSHMWNTKP